VLALFLKTLERVLNSGRETVASLQIDRTPPLSECEIDELIEKFLQRTSWSADLTLGSFWMHATCCAVSKINAIFKCQLFSSDVPVLRQGLEINERFLTELAAIGPLILGEAEFTKAIESVDRWSALIRSHCMQVIPSSDASLK
jgi:hypothetical protein